MILKYQFREQGKNSSFEKKNEFINYCQNQYQKSLHLSSNNVLYYSYDYGNTWNHISNFKSERQSIQNEKNENNPKQSVSKQSDVGSNWFSYLIVIALIIGGVYYVNYHNSFKKNDDEIINETTIDTNIIADNGSVDELMNEPAIDTNIIINSDSYLNQQNSQNNYSTIEDEFPFSVSITEDARNIYAESPFLKSINVSEYEKKCILAILSDLNPNPSGQEGNICNQSDYRCEYCSNFIPSKLYTLQSILGKMATDLTNKYNWAALLNKTAKSEEKYTDFEGIGNEEIQKGYRFVQEIISEYKRGERYFCTAVPIMYGRIEFCSEKCKTEYRYREYVQ